MAKQKVKKILKREDFKKVFKLYRKQAWLRDKEECLIELILSCENRLEKKLLINLLNKFTSLDQERLNFYLNEISNFIINQSGFTEETTQISAITYDDEADSSQKILDYIKMPLYRMGWSNVKTVNRFGAIPQNFKKGKKQIIFIDEFVGSGQTILGRIKQLENDLQRDFGLNDLMFCFVAGMEHGLNKIESIGYKVFCPLRFKKAISDQLIGNELTDAEDAMLQLELRLAQEINGYQLFNYSFGYNGAEALYSLEESLGNTPNSVFPIFWWPRDNKENQRKTLLTRFERGLK